MFLLEFAIPAMSPEKRLVDRIREAKRRDAEADTSAWERESQAVRSVEINPHPVLSRQL